MKKILLSAAMVFIMAAGKLYAQTQHQNSGWFMFLNNTKFNDKWGLQFDVQVRSADDWSYVRNTLVRPALQYFINDKHNVALGYLWQTTDMNLTGNAQLVHQVLVAHGQPATITEWAELLAPYFEGKGTNLENVIRSNKQLLETVRAIEEVK